MYPRELIIAIFFFFFDVQNLGKRWELPNFYFKVAVTWSKATHNSIRKYYHKLILLINIDAKVNYNAREVSYI